MPEEPADADDGERNDDPFAGGAGRDAPLSDLRRDIEERRRRDDAGDAADLFTDVDVAAVDEDDVWERLDASGDDPLYRADDGGGGAAGRDATVVEKRLCHGCPHFAAPPDVACTHDGTAIDAEVDTDHFRVLACPMVDRPEYADAAGLSEDDS